MASKIKVDQILGSTGSTITVPTGQTLTVTDGIPVASGGTGIASFTAGDILYATGATTLTKLNKGTAEQVLAMNSGATAPDWGSVDLTVLPTITVAKGGTGQAGGFTQGDFLYATGATTLAKLAKGTAEHRGLGGENVSEANLSWTSGNNCTPIAPGVSAEKLGITPEVYQYLKRGCRININGRIYYLFGDNDGQLLSYPLEQKQQIQKENEIEHFAKIFARKANRTVLHDIDYRQARQLVNTAFNNAEANDRTMPNHDDWLYAQQLIDGEIEASDDVELEWWN